MALIDCNIHKHQNVVFTSPYISNCIVIDSKVTERIFFVKFYIEIIDKWASFWADSSFLEEYNIDIPKLDRSMVIIERNILDEEKNFIIHSGTLPVCEKCYSDFLSLNNIKVR